MRQLATILLCFFLSLHLVKAEKELPNLGFTFIYNGPDTIFVGDACTGILDWGAPSNPMIVPNPNNPGGVITNIQINISGGFSIGDPVPAGTTVEVEYRATDVNGFTYTFTFSIVFADNSPPSFDELLLPAFITLSCGDLGTLPEGAILDNCTPFSELEITVSDSEIIDFCQNQIIARTYTATDEFGNVSTYTQTLTIEQDNEIPVLLSAAQSLVVDCSTEDVSTAFQQWLENNGGAVVSDNCPNLVWNVQPVNPDLSSACGQALSFTFTAVDPCGNSVSTDATFTYTDATPPQLDTPIEDYVFFCDGSDLVDVVLDWISESAFAEISDDCTASNDISFQVFYEGQLVNEAMITSLINEQVQSGCQKNIELNGSFFNDVLVLINFEFVFRDLCGNPLAVLVNFAAIDEDGPVLISPALSLEMDCADQTLIEFNFENWINDAGGAEGFDNSGFFQFHTLRDGPTLLNDLRAAQELSCGRSGSIEVSFFLRDFCGNEWAEPTVAIFSIVDTLAPTLSQTSDTLSLVCMADILDQIIGLVDAQFNIDAEDDCSDVIWNLFAWEDGAGNSGVSQFGESDTYPLPGESDCLWTVQMEMIAEDDCQNSAVLSILLQVEDQSAPIFVEPFSSFEVECDAIPEAQAPEVLDDCLLNLEVFLLEEITTQGLDSTQCDFYQYTLSRIWIAQDACGNADTAEQLFIVTDTTPPVFLLLPTLNVDCQDDITPDTVMVLSLIQDNCSFPVEVSYQDIVIGGNCPGNFRVERQWQATDVCGNIGTFTQQFFFMDNAGPDIILEPENLTMNCSMLSQAEGLFLTWIAEQGGAQAEDLCSAVSFFAAVPGSYNQSDPSTFPGVFPTPLETGSCDGTFFIEQDVDFVFFDECNNASIRQVKFIVIDDQSPTFINCETLIELDNLPGACEAEWTIQAIPALDACQSSFIVGSVSASGTFSSNNPGNPNTPLNPLTVDIPFDYDPTMPISAAASLEVRLFRLDGGVPSKFLRLFDEDGDLIGQTQAAQFTCVEQAYNYALGSPEKLNRWAMDGKISISLVPNIVMGQSGSLSITDICNGTVVELTMNYQQAEGATISYFYELNDSGLIPLSPDTSFVVALEVGVHQLFYYAEDCFGNQGVCEQEIRVRDVEAPVIVCGDNIEYTLGEDECLFVNRMELPISFSDNCGFPLNELSEASETELTISFLWDEELEQFLAQSKSFTFEAPTVIPDGNIRLQLSMRADLNGSGAFYSLFAEDNTFLGTTESGSLGSCSETLVWEVEIQKQDYINWASDGVLVFTVVPNVDMADPDFVGVQPCAMLEQNDEIQVDSLTLLSLALSVEGYSISYFVSGATEIDLTLLPGGLQGPEINYVAGISNFHYIVQDAAGNADTCMIEVHVIDTIPPTAVCKNTIVQINPSGLVDYILDPLEVDNGSFDNCPGLSLEVSPNTFNCSQIGEELIVTLQVTDLYGLSDACTSRIRIERFSLQPSFILDVCQPDTLRLLANLPPGPDASNYTFLWTGPNGFTSTLENPFIANVNSLFSGTYHVRAQGFGSCFAEGSVAVVVPDVLGVPDLSVVQNPVCEGSLIELETQAFSGIVTYNWYLGDFPNGTLIGTTGSPGFALTLDPGNYRFYVQIETPNCLSAPSVGRSVNVLSQITAVVDQDFIEICAGETLQLGTPITGPGLTYFWQGPSQFESNNRNPIVSTNATSLNSGVYTLQITQGSCTSTIATVEVFIKARPPRPILTSNGAICPGQTLILSVNNLPDADQYIWQHPDGSQIPGNINFLNLANASEILNGPWTVSVVANACRSEESLPLIVDIETNFSFIAGNNGPLCAGDTALLQVESIPGGVYSWTGPVANIESSSMPSVPNALSGIYTVVGTTGRGCIYEAQTQLVVNERPSIIALSSTAPDCVDGTQESCFQASVFPQDTGDYTYLWTGPLGFSSPNATACIPNTSSANNGTYTLLVTNSFGCTSRPSTINIQVKDNPPAPSIGGDRFYCEGGTLLLQTTDLGQGTTYHWGTPTGTIITSNPLLAIEPAGPIHAGSYTLFVTVDGCVSPTSEIALVTMRMRPARPIALGDAFVCEGDSIFLHTAFVSGGSYVWTGPNGFSSEEMRPFIFPATLAAEGNYTVRVSVEGCASAVSLPFFVKVNPKPLAPRLETSDPILCASRANFELTLCVREEDVRDGVRYTWFDASTDERLGGPFTARCFSINDLDRLNDGVNEFYVIANSSGCLSDATASLQVRIDKLPDDIANTGPDLVACNQDELFIQAQTPSLGGGQWIAVQNFLGIEMENAAATSVFGLRPGINQLIWSLNYRSCVDYSRDTLQIVFQSEPIAVDDVFEVPFAGSRSLPILQNDILPFAFTVDIIVQPMHGSLQSAGNDLFEFTAQPNYVGTDQFRYRICANACPGLCSEATVTLDIGDENICDIPTIITPNNDGINDVFFIPCLSSDLFPRNKVTIFNEWGGLIFTESPYSNSWEGTFNGQPVPVGTYFYIVEFGNGRTPEKGFLMIKR